MPQYLVVLVRPQGPINIGMICRLAANLNAGVRLVSPACALDSMDARMFAHHAQDLLAQAKVYESLPEAVADCDFVVGTTARPRRDPLPMMGPEAVATEVHSRGAERVALVFGNEADGLSEEELRVCTAGVQLQTPGPYPSYNLSQAVAITLYMATCAAPRAAPKVAVISHVEEAGLVDYWLGTLRATGYFRRMNEARFGVILQRLVGRLRLNIQDMHTIWGMLAHLRQNDATRDAAHRE